MPAGGEWQGVYFSPLYGYLHILVDGKAANGAWRTAAGDAFGEMHGEVDGNLMKYEWKERRIGAVGADAVKKGHGYFVYSIPKAGEAHEIKGEWGLGEDEAGNSWQAVKQKNMPPDLKSVQPDEYEGHVTGGGWDDSGDKAGGDSDKPSGDSELIVTAQFGQARRSRRSRCRSRMARATHFRARCAGSLRGFARPVRRAPRRREGGARRARPA